MGFFVVITRKVENPVDVVTAKGIAQDFIGSDEWTVIDRDADFIVASFYRNIAVFSVNRERIL
jgi:hypothetical protein